MGRGLSAEQRRILGIAYYANRITLGRKPAVKAGEIKGTRYKYSDYAGPKDMQWPLAAHIIHGLKWTPVRYYVIKSNGEPSKGGMFFDLQDPKVRAVKASIIRAITTLAKRGLLIPALNDKHYHNGYLLTPEGFELGKQYKESFDPLLYIRAGLLTHRFPGPAAHYWAALTMSFEDALADPEKLNDIARIVWRRADEG